MEIPKDEASGRHLIEGRGVPVDGGVFRRKKHPGIVVDTKKFGEEPWFKTPLELMMAQKTGMLNFATAFARENMPVNISHYKELMNSGNDRYLLSLFASKKDKKGKEVGGGSPDAQALFTALLIEKRLAEEKNYGANVAVLKDPEDGHAIVMYSSRGGDEYRFDPTNGDDKFKKIEK